MSLWIIISAIIDQTQVSEALGLPTLGQSKVPIVSPRISFQNRFNTAINSSEESVEKKTSRNRTVDDVELLPEETSSRRKMDLTWCAKESCEFDELREKVVGDHNSIIFDHPATGQVAYWWEEDSGKKKTKLPTVLILVKRNDDELLKVAAKAVRKLTESGELTVMLPPDTAAKFKHYYSVDNDKIQLFDPKPVPGFGGNHLPFDSLQYSSLDPNHVDEEPYENESAPDLVCTLGGDGLLMHASNLFAGPCPPILCVAGGSLGFLTPFSRCEMVDAIRISLGLKGSDSSSNILNGYLNEEDSAWSGPSLPSFNKEVDETKTPPQAKFGANNQICLSMRMRLDCRVINKEGVVRARFNVLNEVVIDRGSSPYLAALECFCDDVHLTTVQADGIIFST